jgi:hypothetical protein
MEVKTIKTKQNREPPNKLMVEEEIKKLRKEHEKPVKGMFEFLDAQGGWLDFTYKFFPGDDIQQFRLTHGEICELPMGIVKHLNNTKKKVRKLNLQMEASQRGVPTSYEVRSRVRFTPISVL